MDTAGEEEWDQLKRSIDIYTPPWVKRWRRLLWVPWTARRSNQSILKEISPDIHWKDWCWSWNFNTLAIWCEELTHLKRPWRWERLKGGGEGDDRGWGGWMASLTQCTWDWAGSRSLLVTDRETWRAALHGFAKSHTRRSNWTELMAKIGSWWEAAVYHRELSLVLCAEQRVKRRTREGRPRGRRFMYIYSLLTMSYSTN